MNDVDLVDVDLNLLVLFEAVFAEQHVGAASKRLHVSSSAVSHGLRRLRGLFDDPLFLRTPKGVVPTARAQELSGPVGEVLSRVRGVLGSVAPFQPATAKRRFTLGVPDATAAVVLPPLLALLSREAPGIDLGVRHLLPQTGFADLDAGTCDLVVLPVDDIPARFYSAILFEEEFVIAVRRGHPFLKAPTVRAYCELNHVLVSISADAHGYIDEVLAQKGLSRRVGLSVANFMLALAALVDTDFAAAIPGSLMASQAARFGLERVKPPLPLRRWNIRAIAPQVALRDAGVAWLFDALQRVTAAQRGNRESRQRSRKKRRTST
jgi:DNA-binding transcriptional LysR family regulator